MKKKKLLLVAVLAFLLLACKVTVKCPDYEYTVCDDCTLERQWVEGDTRYFKVLLSQSELVTYSCPVECSVREE